MLKTLLPLAAALSFSFVLPAVAAPVDLDLSGGQVIQVSGGCGVFEHRGPYGGCRPGGQFGGYVRGRACPRGFHLGPYGQRCQPNRF